MDWSQFDKKVDAQLMNDIQNFDSGKGQGEYEEVPTGKYEVVPEKFEMKMSKNGNPMMVIWYRIVAGDQNNRLIFANYVLSTAFGIHKAKNVLKKLDEEIDVKFESFSQFAVLLDVFTDIVAGQVSFVMEYGEDKTGYKTYDIVDGAFEVPDTYKFEPKN